jgi:outer membrane protein assembly factor BamB
MIPFFNSIRLASIAAVLAGSSGAQPAHLKSQKRETGVYATGWSAVHADAANSDYHPQQGAADLKLAWSRTFKGMINLGPTSDGAGRLFITSSGSGCRLHALDRATGRSIWCSDVVDKLAVASSPLVDRAGHLYVGDGTTMRSFDRAGGVHWKRLIVGVPLSAQFTPAGDLLFITHIGVIYVLDRSTGAPVVAPHALVEAPSFDPAEGMIACMRGLASCPSANTPALDLRSGRFYFTFWTPGAPHSGIRAMRITPGPHPRLVEEWVNDSLPGGSASSPDLSADGKRLYLTDNMGGLHALDAATGASIWSVPIGYQAGGSVSTSPDGLILPAGGRGAALLAVRDQGRLGKIIWRKPGLNNFGIATQAAGFVAYPTVRTGNGTADLLVVDTRTGAQLDREQIPGKPYFTVGTTIDLDGTVYVPTIRGELHAFRPAKRR